MGPKVSFQLSNQSHDPGAWMRVLAEAVEKTKNSCSRKNRVDQMDEGEQVVLK